MKLFRDQNAGLAAVVAGVVLLIILLLLAPLAVIWALNTLFPLLAIPYTFWSWLAVVVLNLTWLSKPVISK